MAFTVPPIHRWYAGDRMASIRMDEIKDQIDFLRNPPTVHVARTLTTQAVAQSTFTKVNFDTLVNSYDPYEMWDAGAPDRLTCTIAGWYQVEGQISVSGSGSEGLVELTVYKNGGLATDAQLRSDVQNFPSMGTVNISKETTIFLNVDDWLHLYIWQSADVSKTTTAGSASERCRLRLKWVSN